MLHCVMHQEIRNGLIRRLDAPVDGHHCVRVCFIPGFLGVYELAPEAGWCY